MSDEDYNRRAKFDEGVENIESLCRRNQFAVLNKQTACCAYICPENDCLYRGEKEISFKEYPCLNIENISMWKYE